MIVSPDEALVITAGRGSRLAVHDLRTGGRVEMGSVPDGARPVAGLDGHFAVHWWRDGRANVSAHRWDAPLVQLSAITQVGHEELEMTGDTGVWRHLPQLYPFFFPDVVRVRRDGAELVRILLDPPEWLVSSESGARITPLPDGSGVLLSSARYLARFLVWDLEGQRLVADVDPDGGTPLHFEFCERRQEMLLSISDTLERYATRGWGLVGSARLPRDVRGWISAISMGCAQDRAAVACDLRPDLDDVAGRQDRGARIYVVDVDGFAITHRADLEAWVGDVHLLSDGRVLVTTWDWVDPQLHVLEPRLTSDRFTVPREPGDPNWM